MPDATAMASAAGPLGSTRRRRPGKPQRVMKLAGTIMRPASEKQIAANRRNAARSKGPVTAEGKARSSRNALFSPVSVQRSNFFSSQVDCEGRGDAVARKGRSAPPEDPAQGGELCRLAGPGLRPRVEHCAYRASSARSPRAEFSAGALEPILSLVVALGNGLPAGQARSGFRRQLNPGSFAIGEFDTRGFESPTDRFHSPFL
jgi:hypothetical protein